VVQNICLRYFQKIFLYQWNFCLIPLYRVLYRLRIHSRLICEQVFFYVSLLQVFYSGLFYRSLLVQMNSLFDWIFCLIPLSRVHYRLRSHSRLICEQVSFTCLFYRSLLQVILTGLFYMSYSQFSFAGLFYRSLLQISFIGLFYRSLLQVSFTFSLCKRSLLQVCLTGLFYRSLIQVPLQFFLFFFVLIGFFHKSLFPCVGGLS